MSDIIDDVIGSQSASSVLSFALQGRATALEVDVNPAQIRRLFLPDVRTKPNATKLGLEAQIFRDKCRTTTNTDQFGSKWGRWSVVHGLAVMQVYMLQ